MKISVKTQIFWQHTAPGILYILIAILGMASSISIAISLISLGCVILAVSTFSVIKGDIKDEMAKENYLKAKASTTTVMHHLLSLIAILFLIAYVLLRNSDLNWVKIAAWSYYAIMGIQSILVGLFFNKWEAA